MNWMFASIVSLSPNFIIHVRLVLTQMIEQERRSDYFVVCVCVGGSRSAPEKPHQQFSMVVKLIIRIPSRGFPNISWQIDAFLPLSKFDS